MLKELSVVVPLSFGKAPRDFVVLLETVVAFLLGAGGHIAEVPIKQFQLRSKHKGSYSFNKKTILSTLIYKIEERLFCDSNPKI